METQKEKSVSRDADKGGKVGVRNASRQAMAGGLVKIDVGRIGVHSATG